MLAHVFWSTNTPAAFIDLMNRVFQNYLDSFVSFFIDDILAYLKNEGDHMGHLRVVFQTLKQHQLYDKYRKCGFLFRSVTFLWHIISSEGVEVYPRKTEAVKNWPRPLTPTNIRCFFWFSGLLSKVHGWLHINYVSFEYFDPK